MTAVSPMLELTDLILDVGGNDLQRCMQCGTCTGVCPWPRVKQFSPRQVIRFMSLGFEGYEEEDLWNCVTCNTCVSRCPRGIDLIEVMRAARTVMLESGSYPRMLSGPLSSLRTQGNPWDGDREQRYAWAPPESLPQYGPDKDYLFFSCCTQSYDPRNRRVGLAMVSILNASGLRFGSLGPTEACCGDQARKVGAQDVFEELRSNNTALFDEHEVDNVIVASPHCLQAFNRDYAPARPLRAVHYANVFRDLVREGKLRLRKPVEVKVTYHDPCYLGRHAGEYEAPRELLRAIPGLTLLEMPRNRERSLCCGGGGGGLWLDVPNDQRFSVLRVREALDTGAEVIATACPYCTAMLEDAIKTLDAEDSIRVLDVAELVAQSMSTESGQILRANEHARLRFGEVVGGRCYRAYKQKDRPCGECPARLTFADGQVHTSREVRVTSNGGCSYHLTSTAPIAEDRHGVSQIVEMSLDVTELHELSEELERQRAIRHDITESSLDALVAVDLEGAVTIYNAAAEQLFGYPRDEVLGKVAGDRLLPQAFLRAIRGGRRSLLLPETQILTAEARRVPVRMSGTVLRSGDRVVGGAAFLQDLRGIKELERQNLRNERMAAVGQTVTQLAHSIKNILTGLQGGIYDIKKGCALNDPERRDDGLNTLDRNFARVTTMVRDFLRLSKDHELTIEECDANGVASEVYELFRPLADKYGIELVFEPCVPRPVVRADPEALHTCLSNLVANAVEACLNHGEGACSIRLSVRSSGGWLAYRVEDTGCGMDEDTRSKLFHSIFTTKGSCGTGLGLMMTKKIVEDHGGRVLVSSEAGHGSIFTVELPLPNNEEARS